LVSFLLTAHSFLLIVTLYCLEEHILFSYLPTFLWRKNVVTVVSFDLLSELVILWRMEMQYLVLVPKDPFLRL